MRTKIIPFIVSIFSRSSRDFHFRQNHCGICGLAKKPLKNHINHNAMRVVVYVSAKAAAIFEAMKMLPLVSKVIRVGRLSQ